MQHTVGPGALALLKEFEQGPEGGFAATPYRCPAGRWTIGWGHVLRPHERTPPPLTADQAEALLRADLERIAPPVAAALRVPATPAMFDALVSLAYNIGVGALVGSTLLRKLNARDYAGAAREFPRWNKARNPKTGRLEPLAGLTRRRAAERTLFARDGFPS